MTAVGGGDLSARTLNDVSHLNATSKDDLDHSPLTQTEPTPQEREPPVTVRDVEQSVATVF